jgi:hypothetical protein
MNAQDRSVTTRRQTRRFVLAYLTLFREDKMTLHCNSADVSYVQGVLYLLCTYTLQGHVESGFSEVGCCTDCTYRILRICACVQGLRAAKWPSAYPTPGLQPGGQECCLYEC